MIKIENIEVFGWETAIRGARNPMNSWDRMDSGYNNGDFFIGEKDYKMLKGLCTAGTDHRKWMRMVNVTMDITAPLYWWKEFDTYKVGTVANSCSTMHKIQAKEFTLDDFSDEHLLPASKELLEGIIEVLNYARELFNNYEKLDEDDANEITKKCVWWQMIQLLPSSFNQKRTVQLNYEVLNSMWHARRKHKLDEWREFCETVENCFPYSEFITKKFEEGEN